MNLKTVHICITAIILIALLCSAGCAFPFGGDTAAPDGNATPAVTTKMSTVTATATVSGVPVSTIGASGTFDPWENFVEPTNTPIEGITEGLTVKPTAVETDDSIVEVTATTTVDLVTLTEVPTPAPTVASVAYTCSYIGGNVCVGTEKCTGAFIKTTDEAQCCAGICQTT